MKPYKPLWKFQLTAARRRLASLCSPIPMRRGFQLTAARRRLAEAALQPVAVSSFQLTAARRRLGFVNDKVI